MKHLWIAGLAVALGASVQAAPLDREHVPEEAKWVLHLDFEAARDTTYDERFREERLDDPNVQAGLAWLKARYGIDARDDLHALTAYGVNYKPHTGTVLLRADYDRDKVLAVVREQADYRTEEHGDYTIHTWTAERNQEDPGRAAVAFHDDKTIVLGSSADEVKRGLDVLDGESAALAEDAPLLTEVPDGTLFQGAAVDLKGLEDREGFQVLQQAECITLAVGEREGRTFLRGRFEAESEDVARHVKSMIDGLMALAVLQLQEQPEEVQQAVRDIKVEVDDQTVKVDWEIDTEKLLKLRESVQRQQRVRIEAPE